MHHSCLHPTHAARAREDTQDGSTWDTNGIFHMPLSALTVTVFFADADCGRWIPTLSPAIIPGCAKFMQPRQEQVLRDELYAFDRHTLSKTRKKDRDYTPKCHCFLLDLARRLNVSARRQRYLQRRPAELMRGIQRRAQESLRMTLRSQ